MNAPRLFASGSAALLACVVAVAADEQSASAPPAPVAPTGPDTSNWVCRFCTFDSGAQGWVEPAVGYQSDASYHFGDYRGLDDKGLRFDLGAAWRYRDAERADAWNIEVNHAGLDSRALSARGGRQGLYGVSLAYDAIPHLLSREASTPFDAQGNLPAGWSTAGSTGAMSDLDASLHGTWLRQRRERTALGLALIPQAATELHVDYRRDEVQGTGAVGGSFMTLASQLPKALHQATDRFELSAAYHNALGQAQIGLASSFFSNDLDALAWQNPYNPPTPGATHGQLGLAPDNRAHRLSVGFGSPAAFPLQWSAQLAWGRMLQDQRFLPATVNPDETVALPRASLDGRVDTTLASMRAGYRVLPWLRLSADFLHDQRNNKTPSAAYTQVVMDTFTGDVRTNVPYSFTRERWRLSVEQTRGPRLGVGVTQDSHRRWLAAQRDTRERSLWGRVGWKPLAGADLRLRYEHSHRDGTGVYSAAADVPAQNPLLQPFQLAERRRDTVRGDLSLTQAALTATFNVSYLRSKYPDTPLGRTKDDAAGYGAELSAQLIDSVSVGVFADREELRSDQAGSQNFALPDWLAEQEDTSSVAGIHADWHAPRSLDLGAEYTLSSTQGVIAMAAGGLDTAFPVLVTRWHDARVYGRYPLRPDLTVRLDLEREVYSARDWALDGVAPDTVPNLLALGQGTRSGNVSAALLSLRYQF